MSYFQTLFWSESDVVVTQQNPTANFITENSVARLMPHSNIAETIVKEFWRILKLAMHIIRYDVLTGRS